MAAPNIVNVTTIYGKTNFAVLTSSTANVLVNSSTSGNVIKVNDLLIANQTSTISTSNVMIGRGTSLYYVAGTLTLPAYSTVSILAKDTSIYLEEGDYIQANVSNSAHLVISYETIS